MKSKIISSALGETINEESQESYEIKIIDSKEKQDSSFSKTDCTILWWNGQYQKPNIDITDGKIFVSLGVNVEKIQMRHAASGAIRFYYGGPAYIPNGTYVLSLWGSTYPNEYISACVSYD